MLNVRIKRPNKVQSSQSSHVLVYPVESENDVGCFALTELISRMLQSFKLKQHFQTSFTDKCLPVHSRRIKFDQDYFLS